MSQNPSNFDTDVIIVGAGPIGMTTACALQHHGIRCRIFEEKEKPKAYSRANNLWARTQELLASIGLRDVLAEQAYQIEKQTVFLDGQPLDQVKLDAVDSPYAKVLYSGQDVIEKTLSEQIARRGGSVERDRKVTSIEQDETGVYVFVEPASDAQPGAQPERLRCRYVVGADGNEGTIRKAVGLDFETEKFEHRANRQVDAKLHWPRSTEPNQLWFFTYHNGFSGVMPVWGGYHRLFFLEDDDQMPDRDPTLDEIQTRAREITGDDTLTLTDPIWFSHSRFQYGVAPAYAKDRVFLVGDAGHFTLPIGGQGMNAGFHDAIGIAWRLAMSLKGYASPVVLDSYNAERHTEHVKLNEKQVSGFKRLMYRSKLEDTLLDVAGKAIPNLGSQLFGSDDLQQMLVGYGKSPLSAEHLSLRQLLRSDVPQAGDRAPDAEVTDHEANPIQLFSTLYNPDGWSYGWSLLAFDGRKSDVGKQLLSAVAGVSQWACIRPRLVLAAPVVSEVGASSVMRLLDRDGQAHSAYGLEGIPALVLIRPDGHIAFHGPADQPELLREFCSQVFVAKDEPVDIA